jgi:hypothetical protein
MTISVVKLPLAKMTFSPDVPAGALGPNEYNAGKNVETDVRGIRSVAGDQEILEYIPGTPTFVTAGFRGDGFFWFVVATDAVYDEFNVLVSPGQWLASNGDGTWIDITPSIGDFTNYNQATNITESWNGHALFVNDEWNPPMFWPDNKPGETPGPLIMYSNIQPITITDIQTTDVTHRTAVFSTATVFTTPPFQVGGNVIISGVDPRYYNGTFVVTTCTTSTVTYTDNTVGPYNGGGTASQDYTWNYDPNWKGYYAKFMRMYNTPNVGSILVAGNLTVESYVSSTSTAYTTSTIYPVTVQWSQNFGLNEAPHTWEPTVINVANQLEVPLRGQALDGFPCNGLFFLCSYWDTVVFSPLNYSTTAAPVLGVRQFNQGRGLLSSNCWANTDKLVYGVDARDIWVFDGQDFQGIGNQRVKNWFYDQLDPANFDRVFMETNTQKSQVEIYYPDADAVNGVPNKMISYRYDIDCWNAPRDVDSATFATESPVFKYSAGPFAYTALPGTRTVVYARGCKDQKLLQKDQGYYFLQCDDLTTGTSTIVPIESQFRRDNIKILDKYTAKLMVHRVLPEVVNLGADIPGNGVGDNLPIYPAPGNITVTVEGANSVGSTATAKTPVTLAVDANGNNNQNPWAQIDQNAFRVNTLELSDVSTSTVWHCSAMTWQVTQVEEDR